MEDSNCQGTLLQVPCLNKSAVIPLIKSRVIHSLDSERTEYQPRLNVKIVVRTRGRDGRIRHAGVGRGVSIPVEQEQEIEQPVFVEQPMMQEDEDVPQHG